MNHETIPEALLLGQTIEHLCDDGELNGVLHAQVVEPFLDLRSRAAVAGFDLRIISGFRSFDRQLRIWNAKARGERPVLNDQSCVISMVELTDLQKVGAIMRYSALPGASRHHWGTDFDLYDAAAVGPEYQVQLVPEETRGTGVFANLHRWLDESLPGTEFYRPYDRDRGGVAVEDWHLSYRPLSACFEKVWTAQMLRFAYQRVDIELADCIMANIDSLHRRFISTACEPD